MITATPIGGLGNQMFIIAAIYTHAQKHNLEVAFVDQPFHGTFHFLKYPTSLMVRIAGNILARCRPRHYYWGVKYGEYYERYFETIASEIRVASYKQLYRNIRWRREPNHRVFFWPHGQKYIELPTNDNLHLFDYFQNEKYFIDNRAGVESIFQFPLGTAQLFLRRHKLSGKDIVTVHVRRGDYLTSAQQLPGVPTLDYIQRALRYFPNKQPLFVTDDKVWVRQHFPGALCSDLPHDWDDMALMILAHNHIISASSFSWWGAWLANKNNVIAPRYWWGKPSEKLHRDIVPNRWTCIKR